jgi:hypothetical protein
MLEILQFFGNRVAKHRPSITEGSADGRPAVAIVVQQDGPMLRPESYLETTKHGHTHGLDTINSP